MLFCKIVRLTLELTLRGFQSVEDLKFVDEEDLPAGLERGFGVLFVLEPRRRIQGSGG
jgi:hypothetical protein